MIRAHFSVVKVDYGRENWHCGGLTRTQPECGQGTGQQEAKSKSHVEVELRGAAEDPRGAEGDGGHKAVLRLDRSSRGGRRGGPEGTVVSDGRQ